MIRMLWVFLFSVLALNPPAHAGDTVTGRTVTVRGEAEIKRAPDKADVSIGIQEQKRDLKEAQKATDDQLKALYRIAKELGIAEKDLRTDYSSVQPVYNYNNNDGRQIFAGYSVNHQVTVTLRDVAKVAELTQKLTAAGIDQINNILFGLQQEDSARDEALELALKKARAKADMLAKASGETLGKVYSISESGVHFDPRPMPMMRGKAMMAMEAAGAPAMDAAAPPPSGEMVVRADVQATFLLQD